MSVSLYAHGPAVIEIGKYGMSLEDAKLSFEKTCEKHGVEIGSRKINPKKIRFSLSNGDLYALINELAKVADIHGDPPDQYTLDVFVDIPEGTYVKTGVYND